MAKVFKYGLIFFVLTAFATNRQDEMFKAILSSPNQVFELIKILVLSACLWNGFLNIIKASGLIKQLSFLLKPILKLIYGKAVEQIYLYLSTNFIANLLGVGSLASISGLKAMKSLTKYQSNPKVPCKEMMLLVIMNTTGLSIIPTTMMTLRQSYGS
ncbi:hypothetical protein, partial [Thomasclavelia cocleata]|uniref:hypothetical protein n=1 Tax=Thomasclavelia cocleata TaxID=69824 RepID=UPI00256EE5EE